MKIPLTLATSIKELRLKLSKSVSDASMAVRQAQIAKAEAKRARKLHKQAKKQAKRAHKEVKRFNAELNEALEKAQRIRSAASKKKVRTGRSSRTSPSTKRKSQPSTPPTDSVTANDEVTISEPWLSGRANDNSLANASAETCPAPIGESAMASSNEAAVSQPGPAHEEMR